jgi:hypothetical protein
MKLLGSRMNDLLGTCGLGALSFLKFVSLSKLTDCTKPKFASLISQLEEAKSADPAVWNQLEIFDFQNPFLYQFAEFFKNARSELKRLEQLKQSIC